MWVIFALLDPDSESESTDLIKSVSNPDPKTLQGLRIRIRKGLQ